jgi:hypothetical protein
MALMLSMGAVQAAGPVTVTPIARDGQLLLSFELTDGLRAEMRDALQSGLPATISYDIEVRRGSAWFAGVVASLAITASARFDNLSRRYRLSRTVDGRVADDGFTEDEAGVRRWMTRFERIPVSTIAALEANGEYSVSVRALARPRVSWFAWPWNRGSVGQAMFTFIP